MPRLPELLATLRTPLSADVDSSAVDGADDTTSDDEGAADTASLVGKSSSGHSPPRTQQTQRKGGWGWPLYCALTTGLALLLLLDSPPCISTDGAASTRLLCRLLPSLPASLSSLSLSLFHLPPSSPPPPPATALPCSSAVLRQLHYLSRSEEVELLRDAGSLPAVPAPRLLVVGMTGSQKGPERMRTALDTWVRNISHRTVFFSDIDDPDVRMVALPSLRAHTGYHDAQHRQLRGMRWLLNATTPRTLVNGSVQPISEPVPVDDPDHGALVDDRVAMQLREEVLRGEVEWVLFADDDTFVNVPALLSLLRELRHSRQLPFMTGNVFDIVTRGEALPYCVGGAGFVMTLPAARMVAERLYSVECPFVEFNDDTIGYCALQLNVSVVHNALFQNGMDFSVWRRIFDLGPLKQESITWHYASDEEARKMQAIIDRRKALLDTCNSTQVQR